MERLRDCDDRDLTDILMVINAAAVAYRGVIPDERWHEPYMSTAALEQEIAARVRFVGWEVDGRLVGVMGSQRVRDADLIRHAYVLPGHQRLGVGAKLLAHLRATSLPRLLVGTWANAGWAIRFYERHGFSRVPAERARDLLRTYWTIPDAQAAASVVLESA